MVTKMKTSISLPPNSKTKQQLNFHTRKSLRISVVEEMLVQVRVERRGERLRHRK